MFCFLSVLSSFFYNKLLFQYVLILQKPNSNLYCSEGIHRLKQSMPKRKAGKMAKSYDPIAPVAEEISEEACLLCFDEFQVNIFTVSRERGGGRNDHYLLNNLMLSAYVNPNMLM